MRQATFADDSREELASLHFDSEDDLRASLDAVFLRRSPKGTTAAGDVPPALPSKNWHRRYGSVSSIETLSSTTGSVMSSSGRGGHSRRGSLSDGSLAFPSASRQSTWSGLRRLSARGTCGARRRSSGRTGRVVLRVV